MTVCDLYKSTQLSRIPFQYNSVTNTYVTPPITDSKIYSGTVVIGNPNGNNYTVYLNNIQIANTNNNTIGELQMQAGDSITVIPAPSDQGNSSITFIGSSTSASNIRPAIVYPSSSSSNSVSLSSTLHVGYVASSSFSKLSIADFVYSDFVDINRKTISSTTPITINSIATYFETTDNTVTSLPLIIGEFLLNANLTVPTYTLSFSSFETFSVPNIICIDNINQPYIVRTNVNVFPYSHNFTFYVTLNYSVL